MFLLSKIWAAKTNSQWKIRSLCGRLSLAWPPSLWHCSCRVPCLQWPPHTSLDTPQLRRPSTTKFRRTFSLYFFVFPVVPRWYSSSSSLDRWCSSPSSLAMSKGATHAEERLHGKVAIGRHRLFQWSLRSRQLHRATRRKMSERTHSDEEATKS